MPPAVPVPALRRAAAPCFPPFIVAPAPAYVTVHFPRCVCPSIAQTQKALAFRPAPFCAPNPRCVRKLFSVLCAPHRLPVRRGRHRPPAQRPTPAAYPKRKKPRLSSRGPACAAKRRFLFYTPVLGFCLRPASPAGAGAVPSPSCAALLPFGVLCQTKNAPFPLAGPARPYCPHPAFRPAPFCAPNPALRQKAAFCFMRSAPASGAPPQAPTRPAQRPTPAAYPKRKKPRLSSRGPACAAKRRFLFYTPVLGFCLRPASPAGAAGCSATFVHLAYT